LDEPGTLVHGTLVELVEHPSKRGALVAYHTGKAGAAVKFRTRAVVVECKVAQVIEVSGV